MEKYSEITSYTYFSKKIYAKSPGLLFKDYLRNPKIYQKRVGIAETTHTPFQAKWLVAKFVTSFKGKVPGSKKPCKQRLLTSWGENEPLNKKIKQDTEGIPRPPCHRAHDSASKKAILRFANRGNSVSWATWRLFILFLLFSGGSMP